MKRAFFGVAVAALAVFAGTPASANAAEVVWCGFTPPMPCGVCVYDIKPATCVDF